MAMQGSVVTWVEAASEDLKRNKTAKDFLGFLTEGKHHPPPAARADAKAANDDGAKSASTRKSDHPAGAACAAKARTATAI